MDEDTNQPINSHYVPKRHLKRFINETSGFALVYRRGSYTPEEVIHFDKICSIYNFYADTANAKQTEELLETDENELGNVIDDLKAGKTVEESKVIMYVSMLHSRSVLHRISGKETLSKWDEQTNPKDFQMKCVDFSKDTLDKYPISNFKARIIKAKPGHFFFTSDTPVVSYDPVKWCLLLQGIKPPEPTQFDIYRYFCPITPELCIYVFNREDFESDKEDQMPDDFLSGYTCLINTLMVAESIEYIITPYALPSFFIDKFNDLEKPIHDICTSIQEERDEGAKDHREYLYKKRKNSDIQ